MYKILGIIAVIALLMSGCGDDTKASAASASTKQVENNSVRWGKVIDFMDLNKAEKAFLNDNLGSILMENSAIVKEYNITFLDIKDYLVPFVESTDKYYIESAKYTQLWIYNFFDNIQDFRKDNHYKQKGSKNYREFLSKIYIPK